MNWIWTSVLSSNDYSQCYLSSTVPSANDYLFYFSVSVSRPFLMLAASYVLMLSTSSWPAYLLQPAGWSWRFASLSWHPNENYSGMSFYSTPSYLYLAPWFGFERRLLVVLGNLFVRNWILIRNFCIGLCGIAVYVCLDISTYLKCCGDLDDLCSFVSYSAGGLLRKFDFGHIFGFTVEFIQVVFVLLGIRSPFIIDSNDIESLLESTPWFSPSDFIILVYPNFWPTTDNKNWVRCYFCFWIRLAISTLTPICKFTNCSLFLRLSFSIRFCRRAPPRSLAADRFPRIPLSRICCLFRQVVSRSLGHVFDAFWSSFEMNYYNCVLVSHWFLMSGRTRRFLQIDSWIERFDWDRLWLNCSAWYLLWYFLCWWDRHLQQNLHLDQIDACWPYFRKQPISNRPIVAWHWTYYKYPFINFRQLSSDFTAPLGETINSSESIAAHWLLFDL